MITIPQYKNKKVGVLGLGKAGLAAVESLSASGAEVACWDDGLVSSKNQQPITNNQQPANWDWQNLSALVLSPGIPLTHPKPHEAVLLANKHNVPIIGDVELLAQACPDATYVGITGTNGKSTTTALIAHILSSAGRNVQVGGNLGVAALALEPLGNDGIYVLEMSSYQLDLCHSVRFNIAAHLNFSPDHLERHGGMEGYITAKKRIFNHQTKEDLAVITTDDEYSKKMFNELSQTNKNIVNINLNDGNSFDADSTSLGAIRLLSEHNAEQRQKLETGNHKLNLSDCRALQGEHNKQNAYVASAVCQALGVSIEQIKSACESFAGLAHRMEFLCEQDNITYINDSKATNADSTAKALVTYDNIYWLVGGVAKDGGISSLTEYFPKVKKAYVIGDKLDEFTDILKQNNVAYEICGEMKSAVKQAISDAQKSTEKAVILLSPAAASFDQFANFEERGDVFRNLVADMSDE